jgi:alkyl sulfatase BDS1-like metallo-beta-lactamase superfamily hydrolase
VRGVTGVVVQSTEELDPDLLLWWLHRQMDTTKVAAPRFTIYVPFTDHPKRYWIVVDHEASLCLADPGFEVDVTLRTDRAALYRTYLGHVSLDEARREGSVQVEGSRDAVCTFFEAFPPLAGGRDRQVLGTVTRPLGHHILSRSCCFLASNSAWVIVPC